MKAKKKFSCIERIKSFAHPFRGLGIIISSQHNAWIHLLATICVTLLGLFLQLSIQEWSWIVLAIVAVWSTEALNTAIEILCDLNFPEFHPMVKDAKDVAAAAVLISALGAAIIGMFIFMPYLKP